MNGAKILLKTLKGRGVKTIYGIVGREAEAILFNEVKGIDFMLTRDERNAAFMADIQGRITNRAGVCYSTFGPGATNLATGIASAYLDRSPVLAISAQIEKPLIHPSTHQYVDQVALMRPITKYAKEVNDISGLQKQILRSIAIAESGIPGPCFLSIPLDILKDEGKMLSLGDMAVSPEDYKDKRFNPNGDAASKIEDLLALINKSVFPVCIVGSAVKGNDARAALHTMLDYLRIPAVTTYGGKGIISCEHTCYAGTVSKYLDYLAPGALRELFIHSDLIILIGVDMVEGITPELWQFGGKKKICAINSVIENSEGFIPVDVAINYAYKDLFEHCINTVKRRFLSLQAIGGLKKEILSLKEVSSKKHLGLNPFKIVHILNELLSEEDIVISDVGLHKQFISLYYESKRPKTFFCSNGLGSMGFGLPAAIGAKKTCPGRRVIAVCGDAGFYLTSPELETSLRHKLPVICIVFCDNSVGLIRHYQMKGFNKQNPIITDFGRVDFVKLAEANGCVGFRIHGEKGLKNILKGVLNTEITVVLEIQLNKKDYL